MNQYQWSTSDSQGRPAVGRGAGRGILRNQNSSTSGRGRGASSAGRGQGVRFNGPTVKLRPTSASSMALQKNIEEMRRRKKEAEQEHFIRNILNYLYFLDLLTFLNDNREQSTIAQSQAKPVMQRFMDNLPTERSQFPQ